MKGYNHERVHISLDGDNQETPVQAFVGKILKSEDTVIGSQTRENTMQSSGCSIFEIPMSNKKNIILNSLPNF